MEENKNNNLIFYFPMLSLNDYEFKIIVMIRMLSDDSKTFKGTIEDMKKWLYIKTDSKINKAIKSLKKSKYILFTKDKETYILTINDEYIKKVFVEREINRQKEYYKRIDRYLDIDKLRASQVITRATAKNIEIIRTYNRNEEGNIIDNGLTSAKWHTILKMYLFSLSCQYDEDTDKERMKQLKYSFSQKEIAYLINETEGGVKNSCSLLRQIPLIKQEYKEKQVYYPKADNQRVKSAGTIHYIIDKAF